MPLRTRLERIARRLQVSDLTMRRFMRWLYPVSPYLLSNQTTPLSRGYGVERGRPLDRYYIEHFLESWAHAIRGRCLELLDDTYTRRFGGDRVTHADILDIDGRNAAATVIADLRYMPQIADASYDTIILTQVLQFIDRPERAVNECFRILRPNGTLLVTLPCLSRIDCAAGQAGDLWRFTIAGAKVLFRDVPTASFESYGNVRSGLLFWIGAAWEDVPRAVWDAHDPDFPVLISVVAIKPSDNPPTYPGNPERP